VQRWLALAIGRPVAAAWRASRPIAARRRLASRQPMVQCFQGCGSTVSPGGTGYGGDIGGYGTAGEMSTGTSVAGMAGYGSPAVGGSGMAGISSMGRPGGGSYGGRYGGVSPPSTAAPRPSVATPPRTFSTPIPTMRAPLPILSYQTMKPASMWAARQPVPGRLPSVDPRNSVVSPNFVGPSTGYRSLGNKGPFGTVPRQQSECLWSKQHRPGPKSNQGPGGGYTGGAPGSGRSPL
jgi:hypothetical protein